MSRQIARSKRWRGARRAEGKPALAVAWGPIEDAGYLARAARDPRCAGAAARRKADSGGGGSGRAAGDAASGLAVAAFAETNWNEARRFLPILAAPFFAEVRGETASLAG